LIKTVIIGVVIVIALGVALMPMLRQLAATLTLDNELLNAMSQRRPLGASDPAVGAVLPTAGIATPAARSKRWRKRSARASLPVARASNMAFSVASQ
jgi:hypothetical protein